MENCEKKSHFSIRFPPSLYAARHLSRRLERVTQMISGLGVVMHNIFKIRSVNEHMCAEGQLLRLLALSLLLVSQNAGSQVFISLGRRLKVSSSTLCSARRDT